MTVRLLSDLVSRLSNTRHGNQAQDLRDLLESVYGFRHISTTSPSAAATVDIALPAGYAGGLVFQAWLVGSVDDQGLRIQMGDGAIDAGANYDWAWQTGGDLQTDAAGDGDTSMNAPGVSDNGGPFNITIAPLYDNASFNTGILAMSGRMRTTAQQTFQASGRYMVDAAVDTVRFFASSGNLTGRIVLFGLGFA